MIRCFDDENLGDIVNDAIFNSGIFEKCYEDIKQLVEWKDRTPKSIENSINLKDKECEVREDIEMRFYEKVYKNILDGIKRYEVNPFTKEEIVRR